MANKTKNNTSDGGNNNNNKKNNSDKKKDSKSDELVKDMKGKTKTSSVNLGKYVVDVSTNPYMRSRIVSFIATGMKPNTNMHVHFNGVNVDAHCAPGVLSGVTEAEEGQENKILNQNGAFGTQLRSDAQGMVYGLFKIPENTFRVGELLLEVNNVADMDVSESSILTSSGATYVASSTTVTSSSTTLSTKFTKPVKPPKPPKPPKDPDPVTPVEPRTRFGGGPGGMDPLAQTFTMSIPEGASGGFVTKIGIYFSEKDQTLGCTIVVVETELGFPVTSKALGRGYLSSAEITTSSDASAETVFVLDHPVYLENDREYAFMIHPDASSPEYHVWTAKTGSYDIQTGEQVFQNPYSGILFSSSSALNWSPLQTEDLKFNIYRANFTTGTGTAAFNNEDDEYLTIQGMTKVDPNKRVEVGDAIIKVVSNTRISNTANVNYAWATVQYFDEANDLIYLDSSNGNLYANDVIEFHRAPVTTNSASFNANTLIANCTIKSVDNIEYHMVVPRFATMFPTRTSISYNYKGTDNTYTFDSVWYQVEPETETEFWDYTRILPSRSKEVQENSGEKSAAYELSLSTDTPYLSPVIDLSRKNTLLITNIINDDNTNEHTRHGEAITKYISQNVVLADNLGNAEDLNVWVGGYRPAGTEIEVWVKFQGSDDGEVFDDKLWTKLIMAEKSANMYSSPIDRTDLREFEYHVPTASQHSIGSSTDAYLDDGILQYARSDGGLIVGFNTFCIKIILLSENSATVPIAADVRAIALQK